MSRPRRLVLALVLAASCRVAGDDPGACTPGEVRCEGGGVQTCADDATWSAPDPCVEQACVDGACTGECAPGLTRCEGGGVQTCQATGEWGAPVACSEQTCIDGTCAGDCAAGDTRCGDAGLETCGEDGAWSEGVSCVDQACFDGACAGVCAPGAVRCDGNGLQTCGDDGEWGAAVHCADQACVAGACTGECEPDATRCDGDGLQTCGADGQWGPAVDCVDQACGAGACTGECEPDATQCDGDGVQTCDALGAWGPAVACVDSPCIEGACVGSCVSGALEAAGHDGAPISPLQQSIAGTTLSLCPGGSNAGTNPPTCMLETVWPDALLSGAAASPGPRLEMTGTVPVRIPYAAAQIQGVACSAAATYRLNGNGSCTGGGGSYVDLPVHVVLSFDAARSNALTVEQVADGSVDLTDVVRSCSVDCASSSVKEAFESVIATSWHQDITTRLRQVVELQLCATNASPCPPDTTAGDDTICRYTDGACPLAEDFFDLCDP